MCEKKKLLKRQKGSGTTKLSVNLVIAEPFYIFNNFF